MTIIREFGSGGRSIGKAVAEKLNIPYYDKELIKEVAEKTGLSPEYIENAGEYAPGKSLLSFLPSLNGAQNFSGEMSASDFLWCMQRQIILDLAERGSCVIVGRCADYIMKKLLSRMRLNKQSFCAILYNCVGLFFEIRKANLQKSCMHTLRHTYATRD